ncbi:MAG: hypothetical protein J6B60_00965 [Clostridia bacterium]|nr:hypothetical protein [Clostridia bacterium]
MATNNILEQLKKKSEEEIGVLEVYIGELEEKISNYPEDSSEAQEKLKNANAERNAYILFVDKINEAAGSVDKFLKLISKSVSDAAEISGLKRRIKKLEATIKGL